MVKRRYQFIEELKTVSKCSRRTLAQRICQIDLLSMKITGIAFGLTGLATSLSFSDSNRTLISTNAPELAKYSLTSGFFWLIVMVTTFALIASHASNQHVALSTVASKVGSAFIYILVATIGMQMDVTAILDNLGYFFIGVSHG
ncbi:DUF819 family protein [Vibrio lentus]|nr:DUF819 family protein [Vibrio lentus]